MKKKIFLTGLLCVATAIFIILSISSYQLVERKLNQQLSNQNVIKIKELSEEEQEASKTKRVSESTSEEKNTENRKEKSTEKKGNVDPAIPVLTLAADTVEIHVGQSFDRLSQVIDITDDKDQRNALFRDIQIKGEYDLYTPGEYLLKYSVQDSDGNWAEIKELKLIVKK